MNGVKLCVLTLLLVLQGCATGPATVSSLPQPPSQRIMVHIVDGGETLYGIAWRYDMDFRQLARANGIAPPYRLRIGQKLSLDLSKNPAAVVRSSVNKTTSSVQRKKSTVKKPASPAVVAKRYTGSWQWPVSGKVSKAYNPGKLHKGLSIKASPRSAVIAAAPGVVVYAGAGLRGYGKLVIIKHSEILLSAYAHNEKILVREGQKIVQSQKIAKLGKKGQFYFEIRKDGTPVNPVHYLK